MNFESLISWIRDLIGTDGTFWHQFENSSSYGSTWQWDYGLMLEYICATIIIVVCVKSIFAFLRVLIRG